MSKTGLKAIDMKTYSELRGVANDLSLDDGHLQAFFASVVSGTNVAPLGRCARVLSGCPIS